MKKLIALLACMTFAFGVFGVAGCKKKADPPAKRRDAAKTKAGATTKKAPAKRDAKKADTKDAKKADAKDAKKADAKDAKKADDRKAAPKKR